MTAVILSVVLMVAAVLTVISIAVVILTDALAFVVNSRLEF